MSWILEWHEVVYVSSLGCMPLLHEYEVLFPLRKGKQVVAARSRSVSILQPGVRVPPELSEETLGCMRKRLTEPPNLE
jgi:hypothetical protein